MKSVTELKTKKEMKETLFIYHKLIDWIEDYYFTKTEEGSSKREWIDDNWKWLCRSLGKHLEEMVENGVNPDLRTLQEIVNDDLEDLIESNGWSVRDIIDRGEDLVEDLHTQNIGTLKEIGWCFESWVEENWERN